MSYADVRGLYNGFLFRKHRYKMCNGEVHVVTMLSPEGFLSAWNGTLNKYVVEGNNG